MRKRRALVVGDSHTQAVKDALRNRETRGGDSAFAFEAYRYAKDKDGRTIGDLGSEELLALVASLAADDVVVSTIGGNQHQVFSLVQHPLAFDLFIPGDPSPAQPLAGGVIPYAQLRDHFLRGMGGGDGARMQQLRAAAAGPVFHLTPPPPKEDVEHILRKPESHFARSGILEKGVSPAAVRLKVWRAQVDVLGELTARLGITLLPPPAGTQDGEGYLAAAFYGSDATHGNAAYGELLLQQIEALAGQADPSRATTTPQGAHA